MGTYNGAAHRQANSHVAAVAAVLFGAQPYPIKCIFQTMAIQPHAVIYVQNLIPLNEEVIAQTTKRSYLTNEHLRVYNDLIKKAAQEKQVVYLDLYPAFVNENGELPAEASKDGVHLRSDWCKQWLAYLQTHTVDFDTLYPSGEQPQV